MLYVEPRKDEGLVCELYILYYTLAHLNFICAPNENREIMAKDLFKRYIWLVATIYQARGITFEEINEKWLRSSMSEGVDLPLKTFHNHRKAIEEMFDINIVCDKRGGYKYYIENVDYMQKGGIRTWLLNTFAVNNLINEVHHLKHRIVFEQIPSGQKFLTPLIKSMRDSQTIILRYKSFWRQDEYSVEVEPYLVKIFRQRWYLLARNINKDVLRTYALDRIIDLRQTERKFSLPKDFSPEGYFYNLFGIISQDNCPPEIVELKVYGTQKEYFKTLPLHHSQEEIKSTDEYSIFRYYLSPTYDFIQEILSQGCKVEVLAPKYVRDEVDEVGRQAEISVSRG